MLRCGANGSKNAVVRRELREVLALPASRVVHQAAHDSGAERLAPYPVRREIPGLGQEADGEMVAPELGGGVGQVQAVLRRLVDLLDAGWLFMPVQDGDGKLAEVRGMRSWAASGSVDALKVRYVTDAAAMRADHAGGVVWQREGTLVEIVDGLLALPSPDTRGSPRLVRGRAPTALWIPNSASKRLPQGDVSARPIRFWSTCGSLRLLPCTRR
jgi:hypothetical protein